MCNKLHEDSKPIPKRGLGWKIFKQGTGSMELRPPFQFGDKYHKSRKWIKWLKREPNYGFCFFLSKKEAKKTIKNRYGYFMGGKWHKPFADIKCRFILKKIEYRGGLGTHHEFGLGANTALCREFKIL